MIQIEQQNDGKLLVLHATGKLTRQDYERFVPEFDQLVEQHGKVRVLFEMHDFHGWQPGALDSKASISSSSNRTTPSNCGQSSPATESAKRL